MNQKQEEAFNNFWLNQIISVLESNIHILSKFSRHLI